MLLDRENARVSWPKNAELWVCQHLKKKKINKPQVALKLWLKVMLNAV